MKKSWLCISIFYKSPHIEIYCLINYLLKKVEKYISTIVEDNINYKHIKIKVNMKLTLF